MQMYTTAAAMCAALALHVKRVAPHLPSPDYCATQFYTAQWRCRGAVYWYQLPASMGNKVLAINIGNRHQFNPRGISHIQLAKCIQRNVPSAFTRHFAYHLQAQHEACRARDKGLVTSMARAKVLVNAMENTGQWPVGFDAVLTCVHTGQQWYLVDKWHKM